MPDVHPDNQAAWYVVLHAGAALWDGWGGINLPAIDVVLRTWGLGRLTRADVIQKLVAYCTELRALRDREAAKQNAGK